MITEQRRAYMRQYNLANHARLVEWRKEHRRKNGVVMNLKKRASLYALPVDTLEEFLSVPTCWLCGNECVGTGQIDHNHLGGKIRGLLCRACNTMLGKLEHCAKRLDKSLSETTRHILVYLGEENPATTGSCASVASR